MLQRSTTKVNALNTGIYYNSLRNVHWYHDPRQAGGERDSYELYNRQKEFGHGEITDHDRYPHFYWDLHKGRTMIQRVVAQWGYSKDLKPEKIKKDLEKSRYYAKLDSLNFLELTRSDYNYIDSDANNAVGYITEDEDDEIEIHKDYGKTYKMAGNEYRELVLSDHCQGRPVYEWQVPYELDVAFGYRDSMIYIDILEYIDRNIAIILGIYYNIIIYYIIYIFIVSTAVDILGTEEAIENIDMKWEEIGKQSNGGILFRNNETMQELLICNVQYCDKIISEWTPNTVIMQFGAERNLNSVRSNLSSTSNTDVYGCIVSLAWSTLYFMNVPSSMLLQAVITPTIIGLNSLFIYRTFFDRKEALIKKLFKKCRDNKCSIIFADWLYDDYDERLNQISNYDNISLNLNNPRNIKKITSNLDDNSVLKKGINDLASKIMEYNTNNSLKKKYFDEMTNDEWMVTFRDAVNNTRINLISHVIHNSNGDRMLMCVDDIDNIPADIVSKLIIKRLKGELKLDKSPLKYDEYYERVQVMI